MQPLHCLLGCAPLRKGARESDASAKVAKPHLLCALSFAELSLRPRAAGQGGDARPQGQRGAEEVVGPGQDIRETGGCGRQEAPEADGGGPGGAAGSARGQGPEEGR